MDKLDEYIEHYEMLSTEYENSKSLTEQFTQLANWLKELKGYRGERPMYAWYSLQMKLPKQYQHVIGILKDGSEAEVYLAHEVWHVVGGTRVTFESVKFWRYMGVSADE